MLAVINICDTGVVGSSLALDCSARIISLPAILSNSLSTPLVSHDSKINKVHEQPRKLT